jgi:uncharacterized membrane protein
MDCQVPARQPTFSCESFTHILPSPSLLTQFRHETISAWNELKQIKNINPNKAVLAVRVFEKTEHYRTL